MTFLFTLLLCVFEMVNLCTGCPLPCICKWRSGKQSVECVNKTLTNIPNELDPATQVLDLGGNNFKILQKEIFLILGLLNLQKIILSRCNLKLVHDTALRGLTNLVELDLSENYLEAVPTEALLHCPSLMKLSLKKNPISSLPRFAFNRLTFLTSLDLSECKIFEVNEAAFRGMYSLEWIDLSKNFIRSFPEMTLFPNTLKGIHLDEIPWTCDCHLRTFHNWIKKDVVPVFPSPNCFSPEKLKGLQVKDLEESDLGCEPKVTSENYYFEIPNHNLSLLCQGTLSTSLRQSWWLKGHVLHNNTEIAPGLHLIYFIEKDEKEKNSNSFLYDLSSEQRRTFYCQAENSTSENYTLIIFLQQKQKSITKHDSFPIGIVLILLAVGLLIFCLCCVALLMTIIRCHNVSACCKPYSNSKTKDKCISETRIDVLVESILKPEDKHEGIFQENRKTDTKYFHQKSNNNTVAEINKNDFQPQKILMPKEKFTTGAIAEKVIATTGSNFPSMQSNLAITRKENHSPRSQPYLKPTLTSQFRPVSAPAFERFVEHLNVRYTADEHTHQKNTNSLKLPVYSYSRSCSNISTTTHK